MATRIELHNELLKFAPKAYFQPPSGLQLEYPCIVYHKTDKFRDYANDDIYRAIQEYQITVIDKNPDSVIADNIESYFQYCEINQYFTVDNLNHTTLNLHY